MWQRLLEPLQTFFCLMALGVWPMCQTYLLGLLAMIKCSICSYQCDNWYVSNRKLACHINFSWGVEIVSLLAAHSRVALAWHFARRGAPLRSSPYAVRLTRGPHHRGTPAPRGSPRPRPRAPPPPTAGKLPAPRAPPGPPPPDHLNPFQFSSINTGRRIVREKGSLPGAHGNIQK